MRSEGVSGCVQAASPDGEAIVTGAGDETLRFWNVFSKTRCTKVRMKSCISSCWISAWPLSHALSSVSRNPNQCWTCSPGYANSQPESNHPITWPNESLELPLFCVLASSDRETPALPSLSLFYSAHFNEWGLVVYVKIQSGLLLIVHCGCPTDVLLCK